MNFLAHIYLSDSNEELTMGNFIGDFVKGSQFDHFPEDIQRGIQLHRSIDQYTDTHPVVLKSKERLRPDFRHYSPVIIDVFYDHFLARDWLKFSQIDLEKFTQNFYLITEKYRDQFPDAARHMLTYMKRDNWLFNYRLVEGMQRALSGMARRTTFDSRMEHAVVALKTHYEEFGEEFHEFFPDLERHCQAFISNEK